LRCSSRANTLACSKSSISCSSLTRPRNCPVCAILNKMDSICRERSAFASATRLTYYPIRVNCEPSASYGHKRWSIEKDISVLNDAVLTDDNSATRPSINNNTIDAHRAPAAGSRTVARRFRRISSSATARCASSPAEGLCDDELPAFVCCFS
jgi:hypothetical protein